MNEESIEKTIKERGDTYGTFEENAKISQDLKYMMHGTDQWALLRDTEKEALEMIALKMSRILTLGEGARHADNWHDIAGYAKLVENQLKCGRCNG